ncbi:phosphoglycerate mutase-like protein [Whalleya microplaca]|nr:phosphoglycerate mutase-like protein [Whalleya microplaca]
MHLLLIRHGESVDNVAGLYAGSRDSPLTSHGVLQARRLGSHLATRRDEIGLLRFMFTSNLQRAFHTAEAIASAQPSLSSEGFDSRAPVEVTRLAELREKDFGSSEGKKYGAKAGNNIVSTAQSDSESREAMKIRIDQFLDVHLNPIIDKHVSENITVVVVAHGIILNVLLSALVGRFPAKRNSPQSGRQDGGSEVFAAWSNTGVLQARLELDESRSALDISGHSHSTALETFKEPQSCLDTNVPPHPRISSMTVDFTNNLDHLQGLKKTKGGIGSVKYDSRQRTMDSFFKPASKKRKLEEVQD